MIGLKITLFIVLALICLGLLYTASLSRQQRRRMERFEETLTCKMQELHAATTNSKQDMLLKQQSTETNLENINQSYQVVLNQLSNLEQNLTKENAQTSEVIQNIHSRISSMNDIMVNNKARGNWGEYQLNTLLSIYAGDSQEIFETQYALKNGTIADVALRVPNNERRLCIDSKFPLENYQRLIQEENKDLVKKYEKEFKKDVTKHIRAIATKYITSETQDLALMFIPSEAIYVYICGQCSDLIELAHKQHVLLASPTTLLGIVFTIVNATKDWNRSQHVKDIEKSVIALHEDAQRLMERVGKCQGYAKSLSNALDTVETSSSKISGQIRRLRNGSVDKEDVYD